MHEAAAMLHTNILTFYAVGSNHHIMGLEPHAVRKDCGGTRKCNQRHIGERHNCEFSFFFYGIRVVNPFANKNTNLGRNHQHMLSFIENLVGQWRTIDDAQYSL
jgi:hypothetical protein